MNLFNFTAATDVDITHYQKQMQMMATEKLIARNACIEHVNALNSTQTQNKLGFSMYHCDCIYITVIWYNIGVRKIAPVRELPATRTLSK